MKPAVTPCLLIILGCLAPCPPTVAETTTPVRPNILFIMTDQQSADAMSCRMGGRYIQTPALDGLAARGTLFTRAYAANPLCMPSRNAIFTGSYPHETGVTDNTQTNLNPADFVNLGNYFQQAGYSTAYFGKWHLCYDDQKTDTHGFETVDRRQKDAITADNAVNFLGQNHDRPFLSVVSFLNPHNVCELARDEALSNGPVGKPPAASQLPPLPANHEPPRDEPDSMAQMRRGYHASPLFPVGNFTPERWRELRWGYYRLIEKVDAEIGKVLTALRLAGLEENTLILFTSDHGECAGAHRLNQKTVLYEESVRVPLIVSHPAQKSARTSDQLVNTGIDLLPTLLDFVGIPKPAKLSGLSLRPLIQGKPVAAWRDQVVVQNNMTQAGLVGDSVPMTTGRMVRTERYKYCVYAHGEHRESLVDLETDPGEMVNLSRNPAFREVLLEHRARLRKFGDEHNDPLVATMLADDVAPRPFSLITTPKNPRSIVRPAPTK